MIIKKQEGSSDRVSRHTNQAFRDQRHSKAMPRFAIVEARV